MHHDVGHTGGISSVLLTVFASIVSWQEQAEWLFRISSLLLACTVSVVVLYGHYKRAKKKKA